MRIINDGAIATVGMGEGRLVPLVIIDTSERPDIEELVRVHQYVGPGDAKSAWGRLKGSGEEKISLILQFVRPAELMLVLEFDIAKRWGLVDQILTSKGIYILPGRDGDRLSNKLDAPKVLIEVPDTGFGKTWEDMWHRHLMGELRHRGVSRQHAKQAARRVIREWREFGRLRMRPG